MKIRKGFVSNSSSSSFVLFFKEENVLTEGWELEDWLKNNKFEDHELYTLMEGGTDGDYMTCQINKEILEVLLKHKDIWRRDRGGRKRNFLILVDPVWKSDNDYEYGLCIASKDYREDFDKYLSEGYQWNELEIDYHGPKDARDWKYEFGDISHEEYWGIKRGVI